MTDTEETGARSLRPHSTDRQETDRHSTDRHGTDPRIADGVEHRIRPARTSVAAALALVFGVSAMICVVSVVLTPIAFILGIIGIILGVVGFKMGRRVGITGKGVAITGLLLSVVSVVIAGILSVGIVTVLNDDRAVSRLEQDVQELRGQLPAEADIDVPQP
jgi:hypothetical protein